LIVQGLIIETGAPIFLVIVVSVDRGIYQALPKRVILPIKIGSRMNPTRFLISERILDS
jgi:hypothetical protein